jgi:hypothetical protein
MRIFYVVVLIWVLFWYNLEYGTFVKILLSITSHFGAIQHFSKLSCDTEYFGDKAVSSGARI